MTIPSARENPICGLYDRSQGIPQDGASTECALCDLALWSSFHPGRRGEGCTPRRSPGSLSPTHSRNV